MHLQVFYFEQIDIWVLVLVLDFYQASHEELLYIAYLAIDVAGE